MKVGIDARMLGYSGIGRYTENLIREILQIDKKNQYVAFTQKGRGRFMNYDLGFKKFINPKSKISNLKIVEVDAPIYSFKEQYNFLKTVVKEKLDVMHFTHFNRPIFYNRPSIITIHDLTPIYFPGKKRSSFVEQFAYRLVLKSALKKANRIIAVSNFTKKDILKNFSFLDEGKIAVIYEGIARFAEDPKQFVNHKSKFLNLKPYLLYVGVWREHKNLLGLIRAYEKLKQNSNSIQYWRKCRENEFKKIASLKLEDLKNLKLVIVGKPDPYYPEVPEAAEKSPFKKDIILTGYVSDEELFLLYQNAAAFVFPSFYEGFGLPPLEAMSYGVPVVSSNAASLPEILGDAALYFDSKNTEEMADKIAQALFDGDLRKILVEKGKKQVLKYSWQKMAQETLKVYNKITKKI